jgi:hypothetical protein
MHSINYEANDYKYNVLIIISHYLWVSYPTRSGWREKNIQITHVYFIPQGWAKWISLDFFHFFFQQGALVSKMLWPCHLVEPMKVMWTWDECLSMSHCNMHVPPPLWALSIEGEVMGYISNDSCDIVYSHSQFKLNCYIILQYVELTLCHDRVPQNVITIYLGNSGNINPFQPPPLSSIACKLEMGLTLILGGCIIMHPLEGEHL